VDTRRVETPSGVVEASTTVLASTMRMRFFVLKMDRQFHGGHGFRSVCMMCSLRVL
jgi:hypothetical protein